MSDLMLLGVLRAPTPEPDNILGISQLVDRARQAADRIEQQDKRIAELEGVIGLAPMPCADDRRFWIQYGRWQAQALAALKEGDK